MCSTTQGELELTLTETFARASNLIALLERDTCPRTLKKFSTEVKRYIGTEGTSRSTLRADMESAEPLLLSKSQERGQKFGPLPTNVRNSFESLLHPHVPRCKSFVILEAHIIRGVRYHTHQHKNKSASHVSYLDSASNEYRPGRISLIFEYTSRRHGSSQTEVFYAIHPMECSSKSEPDPFRLWPDFGGRLWSREYSTGVVVVPFSAIRGQLVWRPWDATTNVVCQQSRVSPKLSCIASEC